MVLSFIYVQKISNVEIRILETGEVMPMYTLNCYNPAGIITFADTVFNN